MRDRFGGQIDEVRMSRTLRYILNYYLCKLLENMNFNQRIATEPPSPSRRTYGINYQLRPGRECVPFVYSIIHVALLGRMALLLLLLCAPYKTHTHQSDVLVHSMKSEKKINKYNNEMLKSMKQTKKKDVVFQKKNERAVCWT